MPREEEEGGDTIGDLIGRENPGTFSWGGVEGVASVRPLPFPPGFDLSHHVSDLRGRRRQSATRSNGNEAVCFGIRCSFLFYPFL